MAFTKVVGAGIHTLAQLETHNIHSAGIVTATKFVGEMESGGGSSTFQDVTISGNLTVNGTTTTLDTDLMGVDKVEVAANNTTVAVAVTQSGAGDLLRLYDSTTEKLRITDDGLVGIGTDNPDSLLHLYSATSPTIHLQDTTQNSKLKLYAQDSSTVIGNYSNHALQFVSNSISRIQLTNDGKVQIGLPGGSNSLPGAVDSVSIRARDEGNLHIRDIGNLTSSPAGTGVGIDVLNNASNAVKDLCVRGSTIIIRNASSESLRIDANGDINLGNNPTNQYGYKLNIQDSQILYAQTASSGGTELKLYLDHGNTIANFGTVSTSHLAFVTANTEKLRIDSGGKVGIGITNPSQKLTVQGTILKSRSDSGLGLIYLSNDGSQNGYIDVNQNAGVTRVKLHSSGVSYFNGGSLVVGATSSQASDAVTLMSDGEVTAAGFYFSNNIGAPMNSDGIRRHTTGTICIDTASAERLRITSAGLVGIGTDNPTRALHVASDDDLTTFTGGDYGTFAIENSQWDNGDYTAMDFLYNGTAKAVSRIASKITSSGASLHFGVSNSYSTGITHEAVMINYEGSVRIGAGSIALPKATQGGVDIDSGAYTVCIGGNVNSSGRTDATDKLNRITSPHRTNAEEPVMMFSAYNQTGTNTIGYGGGSSITNTATDHVFYTAANTTTTNGTERLRITHAGTVNIGGNFTQTTYNASITTGNVNKKISFGAAAHNDLSNEGSGIFFSRQNDGSAELSGLFSHSNGGFGIATREDMTFHTGGGSTYGSAVERLRITSDGKVSIGNLASPDSLLHIHDGSAGSVTASTAAKLTIESSASDYNVLQFLSPNTANQQIRFGDPQDNGAGYINYDHDNSRLTIGVNGPEKLRIDSAGQIGFAGLDPSDYYGTYNDFVWGATSGSVGMTIVSGSDSTGYIVWADGTSSADQYRGRLFYSHGDNSFNFRCNGLANNIFRLDSSSATITGTTDGVLNLDTSSSNGTFIRFKKSGTTKHWIGCATGLGGHGDNDDLSLVATDNIKFQTSASAVVGNFNSNGAFTTPKTPAFKVTGHVGSWTHLDVAAWWAFDNGSNGANPRCDANWHWHNKGFNYGGASNNGCFSTTTGRFTAPVAGHYYFWYIYYMQRDPGNTDQSSYIHINPCVNAANYGGNASTGIMDDYTIHGRTNNYASQNNLNGVTGSWGGWLAAGDTFEFKTYNSHNTNGFNIYFGHSAWGGWLNG